MITNRIYEHQNLLSLYLVSFLIGLRTYQHPCNVYVMGCFQKWSLGLGFVFSGYRMDYPQGWNGLDVILETNTEAKNAWSYNLTPQYTFMVWTGITLVLPDFGQTKRTLPCDSYAMLVVSTVCRPINHLSRKTKGSLYCILNALRLVFVSFNKSLC